MASLASRDSYIQKLAGKVCLQQSKERNKPYVPFRAGGDVGPSKKKNNRSKQKQTQGKNLAVNNSKSTQKPKPSASPVKNGPGTAKQKSKPAVANGTEASLPKVGKTTATATKFSAVDLLRKRLHAKIEENRGQGAAKDPTSEKTLARRARRKMERERKKRKRKEFRMKKLAEEAGKEMEIKQEEVEEKKAPAAPVAGKRDEEAVIFNKVETVEEGYVDKQQKKKDKKNSVKGGLTPLLGRNYKQLLGRVEARKAKLEKLRETDEKKAKVLEEKMKWTNVLYKAEGLKIKDNEDLLRKSLKKKEKRQAQTQKKWTQRSEAVVEKMQRRQDKRKRNLQKRKTNKVDKKKDRARKKGRVLPEDLKKAAV